MLRPGTAVDPVKGGEKYLREGVYVICQTQTELANKSNRDNFMIIIIVLW